jgi:tryptophan 2,3-dioxygenase
MPHTQDLTYGDYLRVPELLRLQRRLTGAHDELQFIIVHQVFELWFKLLLFELEAIREAIAGDAVPIAVHLLRRTHEILHGLLAGFPIIETMRPYDFLAFRNELKPASGFQSTQYREIEFLSGLKDEHYLAAFDDNPEGLPALRRRLEEPTLWDAFVALLRARGFDTSTETAIVQGVIRIQSDSALADLDMLAEAMIEYDLLWSLWRRRHLLMVERMIGARPGTGQKTVARVLGEGYDAMGSGGVEYLRTTLGKKAFPLLWEARTFIER